MSTKLQEVPACRMGRQSHHYAKDKVNLPPEGRVPASRTWSPVWPGALHQYWGSGWGWECKGHRDTGHLEEELRAVAIKSEPRWSALCCGPKKPIGGMTLVSFFLSYWNSATSWDWGVWGCGWERKSKGGGGHLGIQSQSEPQAREQGSIL